MRRIPVAAALIVAAATAASAGAQAPPQHNPNGHFLGRAKPAGAPQRTAAAATNVTYHNGPVQHAHTIYAIFWQPAGTFVPAGYKSGVTQFIYDLAVHSYRRTNVHSVDEQYYDTVTGGVKNYVNYDVTNGGVFTDTTPFPASACKDPVIGTAKCLTDAQLQTQIKAFRAAHPTFPKGLGASYFLFMPSNVATCDDTTNASCAYQSYCGYHASIDVDSNPANSVLYSVLPFIHIKGAAPADQTCESANEPNGDIVDSEVSILSHEERETATDPMGTGWYDSAGDETSDKCAFTFGTPLGNTGVGDYNQVIYGHDYWLQEEWSNAGSACLQVNANTGPVISFTVNPESPAHSVSTTFTGTATDADGIYSYLWRFGDGSTATTATASHAYAAAGRYRVEFIVTDKVGTQTRLRRYVFVT